MGAPDAVSRPAFAAVIFDFDGLILDTELPLFTAWHELYARHGHELTIDEWSAGLGTHGGFDPVADLEARAGGSLPWDELFEAADLRKEELLAVEEVLPGVEDWLRTAAARGIPTAVASSATQGWVEGHLTRLGLDHHFSAIRCRGTDGLPAKPAPDLYLAAASALGVDPTAAIAVEDSPNGITAAKAAGMFCVAVPNHLTKGLDLAAADLIVPSLADLALERLLDA